MFNPKTILFIVFVVAQLALIQIKKDDKTHNVKYYMHFNVLIQVLVYLMFLHLQDLTKYTENALDKLVELNKIVYEYENTCPIVLFD